ncbi:DUF2865 domain-containing protein [Salinarimonas ramus]|uniref:DUF2865 domain-containing protein n=1 Tax=Salinarimonas ramus TaxID=690164 RepID=UPI001669D382|nr:DUF2865 domain-containing protein [Salinarimonas ramus]
MTADLGGGFIELLFGRGGALAPEPAPRRAAPSPAPTRAPAPATPRATTSESAPAAIAGIGTSFCVRTCDGYAFPLGTLRGRGDADLHRAACAAACPGAATELYVGSRDAGFAAARALDSGRPYAALENALRHRRERVAECGCTRERTPDELWRAGDPTLRRGDVLVTNAGALVFDGRGFVDFRDGAGVSGALRAKVDERLGISLREEVAAQWRRARADATGSLGPTEQPAPLPPARPDASLRVAEAPATEASD